MNLSPAAQDAVTVENWAVSEGINTISFWTLQRDNGGCVGTAGAGSCSGVAQATWYFSHTFEPFAYGISVSWGGSWSTARAAGLLADRRHHVPVGRLLKPETSPLRR
jgi:hypothetical protein